MDDDVIRIDGSWGEGGGQILRSSFSLAAVLGRKLEIYNIRKGRKRPGLFPQHLTSIKAVARISGRSLEGAELYSERVLFAPARPGGGDYSFDVAEGRGSAGSTGLVFQAILPPLVFAPGRSAVEISGGTHVLWAPPADYIREVFLRNLGRMGAQTAFMLDKWGWYPKGGGRVRAEVTPTRNLRGVDFRERGRLLSASGASAISNLPKGIALRQRDRAAEVLADAGLRPEFDLIEAPSIGPGSFIMIRFEFENSTAGFTALGERGKPAERVAEEAAAEALAFYRSNACIDDHMADQLVLYAALAHGETRFRCNRFTDHLLTNIRVVEQFLPVRFRVEGDKEYGGLISVDGCGFEAEAG